MQIRFTSLVSNTNRYRRHWTRVGDGRRYWSSRTKGLLVGDPCWRQHPFMVVGKDLEGWGRTSKDVLCHLTESGESPQPVFYCLRLLFAKGTKWVCRGVREIDARFQQRSVIGSKAWKEGHIRTIVNRFAAPYISNVHDLVGGGPVSVPQIRGLADTQEMG